jgi:hypothetical protein
MFFSLFIFFIAHSMHIKDLSTIISFNEIEKSVFEWMRDNRHYDFGKTPIYDYTTEGSIFKKISKVKSVDDIILEKIASGQSVYHKNIIESNYKDRGHIIVCYNDNNSMDINDKFVKEVDNKLKFYFLKMLYAQDREEKRKK